MALIAAAVHDSWAHSVADTSYHNWRWNHWLRAIDIFKTFLTFDQESNQSNAKLFFFSSSPFFLGGGVLAGFPAGRSTPDNELKLPDTEWTPGLGHMSVNQDNGRHLAGDWPPVTLDKDPLPNPKWKQCLRLFLTAVGADLC